MPDNYVGVDDDESAAEFLNWTPYQADDVSPIWNHTIMLLPLAIMLDEGANFK